MQKIGALWIRQSKDGQKYMSGQLQDLRGNIPVVVFSNGKKEKENQPDLLVYLSEPKKEQAPRGSFDEFGMQTTTPQRSVTRGSSTAAGLAPSDDYEVNYPSEEINPADIPF